MNLVEKSLEIATAAHAGQTRRDKVTPYISHPIAVSSIVHEWVYNFTSFRKIDDVSYLLRKASNYYNQENPNANINTFLELFQIISVGHDIFEDSKLITLNDFISVLKETAGNETLYPDSFFRIIHDALLLLTHDEKDSYLDYILKIKGSTFASVVKVADITHNISTRKDVNAGEAGKAKIAVDKYLLAKWILLN